MKKLVLPLMASVSMALLLSACGSNMEDKERKSKAYYKEHTEEANKKLQWCLEKTNLTPEKIIAGGGVSSEIYFILGQTFKEDKINISNCYSVFYLFANDNKRNWLRTR